ncbi:hypothetical protein THARTR1_07610 [Trichoderma harzianum]|uniref:Uncharacterized protein n=1 Tax=Trichoderma harzianum TaxID=5544 RepID=A0A2K0U247_TRIHA|nr:hypothetical protein THARTR1_07610 [Trichoderma harzianum]
MENFHIDLDLVSSIEEFDVDELENLVELSDDPISDEQIELYIYLCTHIYLRWHKEVYLERATQRAKEWVAIESASHVHHQRRCDILSVVLAHGQQQQQQDDATQVEEIHATKPSREEVNAEAEERSIQVEDVDAPGARSAESADQSSRFTNISRTMQLNDSTTRIEIPFISPDMLIAYGLRARQQYEQTRSLDDLDRAISALYRAVDTMPQDHEDRETCLTNLGIWLGWRFEMTGSMAHLDGAVAAARAAVKGTRQEHPNYTTRLTTLGTLLDTRFERTGSMQDIEEALTILQASVDVTPHHHPHYAMRLNNLGSALNSVFQKTASMDDLEKAVSASSAAVNATPPNHPCYQSRMRLQMAIPIKPSYLNDLSAMPRSHFKQTGSLEDVHQAVAASSTAVEVTPEHHKDYPRHLENLALSLNLRFDQTGSTDDINRAVALFRTAVDATPRSHPKYATYLHNLGSILGSRFHQAGSLDDINQAIIATSEAMEATPHDHPSHAIFSSSLGHWLSRRFERTKRIEDLDRAVILVGAAADATPQGHPERFEQLRVLGRVLGLRFKETGSIDDINQAITTSIAALDGIPANHKSRPVHLGLLRDQLGERFQRTGLVEDLDQCIVYLTAAVDSTPPDHPDRALYVNSLGCRLGDWVERTGVIDDLDQAITHLSAALDAELHDYLGRSECLHSLSLWLGRRHRMIGSTDDLHQAIIYSTASVDAVPPNHPFHASCLMNFGNLLVERFERTGSVDDLDEAVASLRAIVDATPHDDPIRATRLHNLSISLCKRFEATKSRGDLDQAITTARAAVDATPLDHPSHAISLNNLGGMLAQRSFQTTSTDGDDDGNVHQAIHALTTALDLMSNDDPARAINLCNLGNTLGLQFGHTGSPDDLNHQLSSYIKGWDCRTAPPSVRIKSAMAAARILSSQQEWEQSSQLLRDAVLLFPSLSPRSLDRADAQTLLAEFAGLGSLAAATALSAGKTPEEALQLLEHGRGVIAGLLMDMRSDISHLQLKHPTLAKQFQLLRDELDAPAKLAETMATEKVSPKEQQVQRRREAEREFSSVVEAVRAQPEFANFLQPPATGDLTAEASRGPIIVINISPLRCDALVVQHDAVQVIALPDVMQEKIHQHAVHLQTRPSSSLEWTWHAICRPILEKLGFQEPVADDGHWPQVWWIPTGLLSQFPLHAAGIYTRKGKETVLDRVISSYASSIKALQHTRRYQTSSPSPHGSALMVSMQDTPGLASGSLQFAKREVDMLNDLCPQLQLTPVQPLR